MIISRTPFRVTLGGGGTDLPSFYERHGGFVLTMAIDKYIYVLVGKRERFKDRINKKTWTMLLSGSTSGDPGSGLLSLTDDSNTVASTATPAGPRYNIVSGTLGSAHTPSSEKNLWVVLA